jgi:hypothetical protein
MSRGRIVTLGFVGWIALLTDTGNALESANNFHVVPLEGFVAHPLKDTFRVQRTKASARAMGLIGNVKHATITKITYADDGSLKGKHQTVTTFFEDGRVKAEVDTDLLTSQAISHTSYIYNAAKKITTISDRLDILKRTDSIDFTYDLKGYLTKVTYKTGGAVTEIVEVTNYPDGRPKEALQRLSSGKAEWRIIYEYKDGQVTIEEFYDGPLSKGKITSTFRLDGQGRPVNIETQQRDESPAMDYDGSYRYTYLSDGRKTLHASEKHPNAKPRPGECTFDVEYFKNGIEDYRSARLITDVFFCAHPIPSINEVEFDNFGNFKHVKHGDNKVELGRAVTKWKFEDIYEISYY